MALREGWKTSNSVKENVSRELTYLADYCEVASQGNGLTRRDATMMHVRLMAIADTISSVETTGDETEDDNDTTPPKRKRARPRAQGRPVPPDDEGGGRTNEFADVSPGANAVPQPIRDRGWYGLRGPSAILDSRWATGIEIRRPEDEGGE